MFEASDIKWVKNVKHTDGAAWAYYDSSAEYTFPLHFSKVQLKGALDVKPGEIILLFQRIDNIPSISKQTYMTHLVTPIDFNVYKSNDKFEPFPYTREVAVLARAEPRTSVFTTPHQLNFFKPNWGKLCDIELLSVTKTRNVIQQEIWQHFAPHFNKNNINSLLQNKEIPEDFEYNEVCAIEGKEKIEFKIHLSRERNTVIVSIAKKRALEKGNGRILCECCDFDFVKIYGEHGYSFIECHHENHIASGGERITNIEDLRMVCSNCHRMLHRKNHKNNYYNVKELRILLKEKNLSK